jgi:hypothetical protein
MHIEYKKTPHIFCTISSSGIDIMAKLLIWKWSLLKMTMDQDILYFLDWKHFSIKYPFFSDYHQLI